MNATIEKIVNVLFEDLAETEETIAIREEILQNCQERYQDLCEAGISEDEAIRAVIESLNGMEEMLNEYPRKADRPVQEPQQAETAEAADTETSPKTWSCDPSQSPVREIRMERLGSANVNVRVSRDDLLRAECVHSKMNLVVGHEGGVLNIGLSDRKPREEIRFSLEDGFDLSSLGRLFEKLTRRISSTFSDATITLEIPASLCPALRISTISGDVSVEPVKLERLQISTASGDIDAAAADVQSEMRLVTAGGDVDIDGALAQQLHVSSVGGDVSASDCLVREWVRLNTTSGDIHLSYPEADKMEIDTTSGSVTGHISPEYHVHVDTVSGDVSTLCGEKGDWDIETVSGDVDLRS